jgi:hypothetical protein
MLQITERLEELLTEGPAVAPDLDTEIRFSLMVASPRAAALALIVLHELRERAEVEGFGWFLHALDAAWAHAGGHGEPELAWVLLDVADAVRLWEVTR